MREGAGLTAPPPGIKNAACRRRTLPVPAVCSAPRAASSCGSARRCCRCKTHSRGRPGRECASAAARRQFRQWSETRRPGSRRRWPAPGSGNPPAARGSPSRMRRKTHDKIASYAGTRASATLRGRGAVRRAARTPTRSHTAYRCGSLFRDVRCSGIRPGSYASSAVTTDDGAGRSAR